MVLKGGRIVLRPLKMSDASRFVKWFRDPTVNKFLARRKLTLQEEKKFIRGLSKKKDVREFSIDTKEGVHIGSIGLHLKNKRDRRGELGIMIGDKRYWNKGYGTDAIKVVFRYGFKKLKLHRIELDVYEYNSRAVKVYRKSGFKIEGVRREHVFYQGRFHNTLHMAILDREWLRRNR